jgi:hypothetical protein
MVSANIALSDYKPSFVARESEQLLEQSSDPGCSANTFRAPALSGVQ